MELFALSDRNFLNYLQILTWILRFVEYPIPVGALGGKWGADRYRITEKRKKLDSLSGLVNNWSERLASSLIMCPHHLNLTSSPSLLFSFYLSCVYYHLAATRKKKKCFPLVIPTIHVLVWVSESHKSHTCCHLSPHLTSL